MSTNIYDIANELERAIRNLPEYKAVEALRSQLRGIQKPKKYWKVIFLSKRDPI